MQKNCVVKHVIKYKNHSDNFEIQVFYCCECLGVLSILAKPSSEILNIDVLVVKPQCDIK